MATQPHHPPYPDELSQYIRRLFDPAERRFACRATSAETLALWQAQARAGLRRVLGIDRIAVEAAGHRPAVELGEGETIEEGIVRRRGTIETEPGFVVPFYLLEPAGGGPHPLALTPHGHAATGTETSAGVFPDDDTRDRMLAEDRDVAVQAARRGYLAIAPTVRGTGSIGLHDLSGRHDRDCRAHAMHCLLAGRTATGERVWDTMALIDWALETFDVDASNILCMGNSGGGMVTTYAAAIDPRIATAVASCSFAPFVAPGGFIHHCDCNAVPGIMRYGEFWDVAALIAPRRFLVVHGKEDPLFTVAECERAAAEVRRVYEAAGAAGAFELRWGEAGHRFYKELMWGFIEV